MRLNILIIFLAVLASSTGCNLVNPVEKTPTYLHVDSIGFTTGDYVREGTGHQKITSAWVFFNDKAVGVFNMPFTVPVLMDGPGQIQVIPGVTINGLSYETQYPFFNPETMSAEPKPGGIINFAPKTSYVTSTQFQWKENFELGNSFVEVNSDDPTDTSMVQTLDPTKVFEGGAAGYIYLDGAHTSSESISNISFPVTQGKAYLEIHYKSSTSFQVGMETLSNGSVVTQYIAGVKAKDSWNKLYIDLSSFTSQYQSKEYRLMIKTVLDDGLSSGYVLLDNIKVLSF